MTNWCSSCLTLPPAVNVATLGGINGMSEVQRYDDVGTVLRFLSRLFLLEMFQLRGPYRPHHFSQSPKESGRLCLPTCCRSLRRCIKRVGFLLVLLLIYGALARPHSLTKQPLLTADDSSCRQPWRRGPPS